MSDESSSISILLNAHNSASGVIREAAGDLSFLNKKLDSNAIFSAKASESQAMAAETSKGLGDAVLSTSRDIGQLTDSIRKSADAIKYKEKNVELLINKLTSDWLKKAEADFQSFDRSVSSTPAQLDAVTDSTKEADAALASISKLAGGGIFGTVARDLRALKDGFDKVKTALDAGGKSAIAVRAGLAGIVLYGTYKVGSMLDRWINKTDEWEKKVSDAVSKMKTLDEQATESNMARYKRQIEEMTEGMDLEKKRETVIGPWASKFQEEIDNLEKSLKKDKAIKEWKESLEYAFQQVNTYKMTREVNGENVERVAFEFTDYEWLKARIETDEKRLAAMKALKQEQVVAITQKDIEKQKTELIAKEEEKRVELLKEKADAEKKAIDTKRESLTDELNKLRLREEQYELLKLQEEIPNDRERQKLEILVKQKHELERQKEKQEELAKMQDKANNKRLDAEIKGADQGIKSLEKEIDELSKIKIDVSNPSLTSKDERMTSLSRGTGDIQHQQLEQAKRQVKIAELQQKLMAEIARYQKLIAEKEDPILSLGA